MITIHNLEFGYRDGGFRLRVPALEVAPGETVAVVGPSGCGKTTFLNLVAACIVPQQGTVTLGDVAVSALSDAARRDYRIRHVGLVFQEFELLSYGSVLDNVLLPYRLTAALTLDEAARQQAMQLIDTAGLADKRHRRVDCLSQGERQRVAVCRALATQPALLLCDEPTGNLDPDNAQRVLGMLLDYASAHDATLLSVTHDHTLLSSFARTLDLQAMCAPPATAGPVQP